VTTRPRSLEAAGFRQTFLVRFTRLEDRVCLEHLAALLDELTEQAVHWPETEETPTSLEYEAVRIDLEHSLGVLERLSTEPERTHLGAVELKRTGLSERLGRGLRRLLAETVEEDPAADV
jgi:hypothetical protein